MLIGLLFAAMSQPSLGQWLVPPGSFGWLETLAGSCFSASGPHNSRTEECFAVRDGRFRISSRHIQPRFEHRYECGLTSAAETVLRFDCVQNGVRHYELMAHYEGEDLVFRTVSRSRAAEPPHRRSRSVWRRLDADRISITVEMADGNRGWLISPFGRPRLLVRSPAEAD